MFTIIASLKIAMIINSQSTITGRLVQCVGMNHRNEWVEREYYVPPRTWSALFDSKKLRLEKEEVCNHLDKHLDATR